MTTTTVQTESAVLISMQEEEETSRSVTFDLSVLTPGVKRNAETAEA